MKRINEKYSKAFANNFKELLKNKNMTQLELVDKFKKQGLKVSQQTISSWIHQGKLPHDETLTALCKILRVKESDLIPPHITDFPSIEEVTQAKYPLMGVIAAGEPIEMVEDIDIETFIATNRKISADFALLVKGDSMEDFGIYDRYFVFIKQQPIVKNGEIAAIAIDNETTLKKFYYDEKQQIVTLIPGNSKYKPMIYTKDDFKNVRVLGKAVYFQGML